MSLLTDSDVDFITNEIARSPVSDSLKVDLTDHFCCVIEEELARGFDFRTAWQVAYTIIAPNGINEIEDEKQFLIANSKIKHMKKSMFLLGFLTTIGFTFTVLFKFQHWPGAMVLLVITNMLLVFGLLPLLFAHSYRKENQGTAGSKFKHILGYLGFALLAVGLTFKFSHWPSANIQLVSGIIILNLGYFPMLFLNMYRKAVS